MFELPQSDALLWFVRQTNETRWRCFIVRTAEHGFLGLANGKEAGGQLENEKVGVDIDDNVEECF